MKNKNIVILIAALAGIIYTHASQDLQAQEKKSKKEQKQEYLENIKKDSIDGVYIPTDLNDCFKQIDGFWVDSIKTQVRKMTEDDFTAEAHFGFGMWIRNNWRLWGGSRLSTYFNELGISHPDDMSSIILTSYHRYLMGLDIKLEEQIRYYQNFWKKKN